jgi:hypothetical protein
VTAATPDPVRTVQSLEAVCATVWAGSCLPDHLETPLDEGVERLGPKLYYSQFRKFRQPLAEGRAFVRHVRFCPARGTNTPSSASLQKSVFGLFLIVPVVLAFILAYWVYQDGAGRGDENAALWAVAVGGLTITTFFGGLLTFAVYLWQRE